MLNHFIKYIIKLRHFYIDKLNIGHTKSSQFRKSYPTLTRAYELVALMYNLLTANGFPHKEAITKIRDDHKDLPGFSTRKFTGAYHVIIHMFLGELCHHGIKTVY
jgi:hypothetical protein